MANKVKYNDEFHVELRKRVRKTREKKQVHKIMEKN